MNWDDPSGKKPRNPWERPGSTGDNNGGGRGPWSGGGKRGGGSGQEPPDLDALLRKAQANFRSVMPGDMNTHKMIGLGVLAAALLWLSSGVFMVSPGEHAVIQRFGAWSRTETTEGLHYRWPAPIEAMNKVNVNEIRLINLGFADSNTGPGQRELPEESMMLTSDRNIVDLNLAIQWNIKSAEDYLFQVLDQENTIKKVAESAIREAVGQTEMFLVITSKRKEIADETKAILQANLDEYKSGVNITQVLIEKAEVHPDVQDAFQDVQSAKQDGEDVQNRAEAYRQDILPKARGAAIQMAQEAEAYRQTVIARATGDAERFNSIYSSYLGGKDVTKERMYLETMEQILKNAQKIIFDNEKGGSSVVPYLPLNELNKNRTITPTPPAPNAAASVTSSGGQ
jgi:membrane protease subunit HflK